jgi:hypothetical protein
MSEHNIQRDAQIELSSRGSPFWRNNVAKAWVGTLKIYNRENGRLILDNARPLEAGLAVGSGDIIGIKSVTITQDMVGQTVGIFCSGEAKVPGKNPNAQQLSWAKMINERGGIAGAFHSIEEAVKLFCS